MKIVVIGGSGLIGKNLVSILRQQGHEALSASPSSGVNALTGEGLAAALVGARSPARPTADPADHGLARAPARIQAPALGRQAGAATTSARLARRRPHPIPTRMRSHARVGRTCWKTCVECA